MKKGLVLGVGITDVHVEHQCPYYNRWKGVLRRCFSEHGDIHSAYDGCSVSEDWLIFSAFKEWMKHQPWEGNQLDKDILRPWEKRYCPETSVFVPGYLNTLVSDNSRSSSGLPTGVARNRRGTPYRAMIRCLGGEKRYIGRFNSPEEAHQAWAHAKSTIIVQAVERYRQEKRSDERVCLALLDRAKSLAAI
ncbi:hypothetical protein [Pseudomonas oryzihabitans]|uniref:hypothetical protein n=1 Tax=Pseudomonas oryzihabitans TaxID=47885 RepID=UPI0011102047|nr:hypothetical protein [Pseudomonas psychrotolerans]